MTTTSRCRLGKVGFRGIATGGASSNVLCLIVLLLIATGCGVQEEIATSGDATSGGQASASESPAPLVSEDAVFCDIERGFPGFAGAFLQNGQLVINFAGPFPRHTDRLEAALEKYDAPAGKDPVLRRVRYTFCQLAEWYEPFANKLFQLDGVVASEIDEIKNRIWVGVEDIGAAKPMIDALAKRQGIPSEAVRVEEVLLETD